ncbi:CBS domain-containing protein [Planomicrobium sp. Y74]|uniref:CBS domain-containing protein n=1 Tax=Planomicrobium sp. Y74 TaxID=2478977 RepID=UPI000EF55B2D|nr:CBS domain-containing protein [Planomicrobium sp. Y74]RLQ90384.1 CBS domain-containing protein [Planomicrobium sp. Y74]
MDRQNSERFLIAFNKIEKLMKGMVDRKDHFSFFKAIELSKKEHAAIRKYEDELREFGDLRNAIVHHRTDTEYAIAEPHTEIVELIEHIEKLLSEPVTVGTSFARKVHTFQAEDTLSEVLRKVRDKNFKHIPVYHNDEFMGLLTANGIMRWLAATVEEEVISREITTMDDILKYEKNGNTYRFIASNTPVYEAEEVFKNSVLSGHKLEALLITRNGKEDETLTGIITPIDLIQIE